MRYLVHTILLSLTLFATGGTPTRPPTCEYKDILTSLTQYGDWRRTLLDSVYKLPEAYIPPDLVRISEAGVGTTSMFVRSVLMNDLKALLKAANSAGIKLEVQSAYRSYTYQAEVFEYWVGKDGYEVTLKSSARAGHSEHQLGTALDFRGADSAPAWEQNDWGQTREGKWLSKNAPRFGFIMSYPKGKQNITCYIYEPWHYRYVGVETAAHVQKSGMTLREWLWASSQNKR